MIIRPQPGFQETALSTSADIAIMGGAAGAGKTFTLLLESIRNANNSKFRGTIFRRTTPQIKNGGGLWDTSQNLYPILNAKQKESLLEWEFPSGAKIKFAHLEYEKNKLDWQGAQIPFIGFDELTHFTESQFFYMLSRNRSDSGVRPYVRATCNPDPDSWVAKFIDWWIDVESGFPIPERAGKIRYFTRDGDVYVWGDSVDEVYQQCPHIFQNEELIASGVDIKDLIKSVTFIPGNIYANKILIAKDPAYLGNLLSLRDEEKAQLLEGNWKIRIDGLQLCNHMSLKDIFTNYPENVPNPKKCITVDAARFGRDFCVIFVWKGWEVIHTVVYKKSDVHDIVDKIEKLRMKFNVQKSNVVVDQDGVGGGTVKLGNYVGFHGGNPALKDFSIRGRENYANLKTQCYYHLCEEHINKGNIRLNIHSENCEIFDDSKLGGHYSTKIKIGRDIRDIRDLIIEDLRVIKRSKTDIEGKLHINSKDEQKTILGRSPDFADTLMMRKYLDLIPQPKYMTQA